MEVTGSFLLWVAWLNYLDRQNIVPMAVLACTLHELGHLSAIRCLGGTIKWIRLTAIGAEMKLDHPLNYWQEGLAALAGPGVNLLLALLFCWWEWGAMFSGLNLVLGCFNLIPVSQLDGGRAFRCTLSLLAGPELAFRAGTCLDICFVGGMVMLGLVCAKNGGSITLLLVSAWLVVVFFKEKEGNWGL